MTTDIRLRAFLAHYLGVPFDDVALVCWCGTMPVFDVPSEFQSRVRALGFQAARPETVRR